MNFEFLTADKPKLFPFLETVLQDGGRKVYAIEGEVKTIRLINGMSGFTYQMGESEGELTLGLILGGTGYVLRRSLISSEGQNVRYDYFNSAGEVTFTSDAESLNVLFVDFYEMDLSCPILNHLYNFLSLEYKLASEAKSHTELVNSVEIFLRQMYRSKMVRLPIKDRTNDPAVTNIYNKILKSEMDPVLTWEERHLVFAEFKKKLNTILETKVRAHRLSKVQFRAELMTKDGGNFLARFLARPSNNTLGLLYTYTIGKIIWFFQTVKNNLGYSVALAVYGPFTYYFITMPMNPHAMQAVGRVRSAYLDAKTGISQFIDTKGQVVMSDVSPKQAIASTPPAQVQVKDSVTVKSAAPATTLDKVNANIMANIIFASPVTTTPVGPVFITLGDGKKEQYKTGLMNMLLSTDVSPVDNQTWIERMSNFKQMQIGYEENIEYASRMGRLEQLETQYNFPMQVESTWEELERYNSLIFKLREENPNLSAKMKQYLFNEINRTQQLQLYLWDRMARFILDQPYVMLDQDKEQKRNDYYVGRSFVFMEEMTNILSWRYKNFKKPKGYDRIEKLAKFYTTNRKDSPSVLRNLKENSDLFKQKDIYSTAEFRSYMKRQWEILFLQNAKAEEASNMGLNMYIWSVRNTVWVLQSIYSAKRDELSMLMKRDVSGSLLTPAEMTARAKISMLYETLFHNLTLEYVGIREEIMARLGKDIESAQRMVVIDNLKEFLSDREKLDGVGIAQTEQTAGAKL